MAQKFDQIEWKRYLSNVISENWVVLMSALLSLVAPQVVVMTTCGATSDNKADIIDFPFPVHNTRVILLPTISSIFYLGAWNSRTENLTKLRDFDAWISTYQ